MCQCVHRYFYGIAVFLQYACQFAGIKFLFHIDNIIGIYD